MIARLILSTVAVAITAYFMDSVTIHLCYQWIDGALVCLAD